MKDGGAGGNRNVSLRHVRLAGLLEVQDYAKELGRKPGSGLRVGFWAASGYRPTGVGLSKTGWRSFSIKGRRHPVIGVASPAHFLCFVENCDNN